MTQVGKTKVNGKSFCQWLLRTIAAVADEGSLVNADRAPALGIGEIRNAASFVQQQLSDDVVGAYLKEGTSRAGTAEPFAPCFARAEHDAVASLATLFETLSGHARDLMAASRLPVSATMRLCAQIVLHPPFAGPVPAAGRANKQAITVALGNVSREGAGGADAGMHRVAFAVAAGDLSSEFRPLGPCLFVLTLELAPPGGDGPPTLTRAGVRAIRVPQGEAIAALALYGSNAAAIVTTAQGAQGSRLVLVESLDEIEETDVPLSGSDPLLTRCLQVRRKCPNRPHASISLPPRAVRCLSHAMRAGARTAVSRRHRAQLRVEAVDAAKVKSRALHARLDVPCARLVVNPERRSGRALCTFVLAP
jgi:hypothetical protein